MEIVAIHNNLLLSKNLNYDYLNYKIFFKCVNNFLNNQDTFFIKKIEIKDIIKSNNYKEIKRNIYNLYKPLIIEDIEDKNTLKTIGIFTKLDYKNGFIDYNFTEEIIPFIQEIKNNYTLLDIDNIIKLNYDFSIKMYLFLKMNKYKRTLKIDINKLYDFLNIPQSYRLYKEFKRHILKKIIKDFENIDIKITSIIEHKENRRITHLTFKINNSKMLLNEYIQRLKREKNTILAIDKETGGNVYINENGLLTIGGSILDKKESLNMYKNLYKNHKVKKGV